MAEVIGLLNACDVHVSDIDGSSPVGVESKEDASRKKSDLRRIAKIAFSPATSS
jgi:hypothetical protein